MRQECYLSRDQVVRTDCLGNTTQLKSLLFISSKYHRNNNVQIVSLTFILLVSVRGSSDMIGIL